MANPSEQPTVGAHPPSMPNPPLPQPQRLAQPDAFINMIQGASIPVIVGAGTSSRTFILPVGLLCHHSIFFQNQCFYLNGICVSYNINKKRKFSETKDKENGERTRIQSGGELKADARTEMVPNEKVPKEGMKKPEMIVRLPDVDPAIFGLFLGFIYKDAYPDNVDASTTPGAVHPTSAKPPSSFTPIAPTQYPTVNNASAVRNLNGLRMPSGPAASKQQGTPTETARQSPFHNAGIGNSTAAPKLSHKSPYRASYPGGPKLSTSSMAIPTPHPNQSIITPPAPIPPSIHAYLLAHRLSACAFMNYTTTRLYVAIGRHFALTPTLIAYIWQQTQSFPPGCPLRRLILDFLVAFWSHPDPAIHHGVIQRGVDWDALFDEHKGLRNDFIKGLQGAVRLLPVKRYYVTLAVGRREVARARVAKEGGAARKEGDGITKEGGAITKGSEGVVKEGCKPPLVITEGGAVAEAVVEMAESGDKNTKDDDGGPDECNTVVVKVETE